MPCGVPIEQRSGGEQFYLNQVAKTHWREREYTGDQIGWDFRYFKDVYGGPARS